MTTELSGKTALVTGATSGIGSATAIALARYGAHVIVSGRDAERGAATVEAIRSTGGRADFVAVDLADIDGITAFADAAVRAGGGHVDIVVNNAGIYPFGPSLDATTKEFDAVYDINVKAPFFLTTALAPAMAERGHGVIVNVSTALATKGFAGAGLYSSSKAAVETLTKVWAAELGPRGIRVNAVSPGPILTEGTSPFGAEGLSAFHRGTPADRVGTPAEVAELIAFLAGDDAGYIHGTVVAVDGGATTL
jgi:NAD(P)-dependent dehydrogenase (short-subunit alcohol dehydrogenase family)